MILHLPTSEFIDALNDFDKKNLLIELFNQLNKIDRIDMATFCIAKLLVDHSIDKELVLKVLEDPDMYTLPF